MKPLPSSDTRRPLDSLDVNKPNEPERWFTQHLLSCYSYVFTSLDTTTLHSPASEPGESQARMAPKAIGSDDKIPVSHPSPTPPTFFQPIQKTRD